MAENSYAELMSLAIEPVPLNGKEALLRATVGVVARGGLRSLTYRAVAAEAGVSHGLVRHHFGSRDQLVADALTYAVEESLVLSNMRMQEPTIDEFAQSLVRLTEAERELQMFQYELLIESRRRPELAPAVRTYYEAYETAISDQLSRIGVRDEQLARLVWFTLDGLVFKQLVFPGDVSGVLDKLRDEIRRSLTSSRS